MSRFFEDNQQGYQGNVPSEIDHLINQSKKARKTAKKKKEGTDGIDAIDEIDDNERLNEGFSMMSEDY